MRLLSRKQSHIGPPLTVTSIASNGHFFSGAIGGLGTGLGTALGVKCVAAQKPVILLIGDGSFNYNPVLAGLGFCQEFRMPIMIVVLNNQGYLSQKLAIPLYYPEGW